MLITLELPDDLAKELETRWTDLPRAALESTRSTPATRAFGRSASQIAWFRNAHAGRRLFEAARSPRLLGGWLQARIARRSVSSGRARLSADAAASRPSWLAPR